MIKLLKRTIVSGLFHSGLLGLYASKALRGRVVVLTYHRVLPRERIQQSFSSSAIIVTPETFESHMRFLRSFMRPVSVDELASHLSEGKPLPPRTCVVTFDDGWYDNLEFALPILKRYSIPAVLFVATDYLGTDKCFWQERLGGLIFKLWQHRDRSGAALAQLGLQSIATAGEQDVRKTIERTVSEIKNGRTPPQIEQFVADVEKAVAQSAAAVEASRAEDRFLSWAQVQELQASGVVTIGSHAMTHTPLDRQDIADTSRELQESRRLIRERLGSDPATFAYPNGDFDDDVVEAVRTAGYALAFTTKVGIVSPASDRLRLERVNIHEAGAPSAAGLLGRIVAAA